ncbi:MAG: Rieske 2Fe-2S domain-containing protein [Chloroflexota bacterium]
MSDITRRDFLKLAQGAGALLGVSAIAGPVVAYFYPPKLEEMPSEPVLVCPESELPVGGSRTIPFGRYPALVIHTPGGLKAYSAVCTHFACIVKWNAEDNMIECPCHEGFFDPQTGEVVSGPPPAPLEGLETEIVDGLIYVKVGGAA